MVMNGKGAAPSLHIRPATPGDTPAIAAIYTHHILHGTGTFEEAPVDAAEMAVRLDHVVSRGWPWLVASEGTRVLGYGYAAQFRDRAGYRIACEDSLYLDPAATGRGVGDRLLGAVIEAATACGFERMFAVIGDSANAASIGVHLKHGFTHAGRLDRAGLKFGRYIDVVFMQRAIGG